MQKKNFSARHRSGSQKNIKGKTLLFIQNIFIRIAVNVEYRN